MKRRIEQLFEVLTGMIFTYRWAVIALMIVLGLTAVRQLPNLTIDMSDEGFLHPDDPILTSYNDFRDQFGRDDLVVLSIESDAIFSQPFLHKLKNLHDALADKVPHLDEITSMVNARNTRGIIDGIIVEDLLEKWPEDDRALETLKQRVLTNPLYRDRLISADGRTTTIILQTNAYSTPQVEFADALEGFDAPDPSDSGLGRNSLNTRDEESRRYISEEERGAIVMTASTIAAEFNENDFKIFLAGSPVVTYTVKKTMRADMMLFLRLAVLTISICLFVMFRRLSAVIFPLLVVVLALVSTLATMAIFGVPIKMPTMIIPSFLLAVGVGDSVHILSIFFQKYQKNGDKRMALVQAMGHSGLAVVMTSLTTAAGLASFFGAKIAPVADLGIFASIGVMLAMLYSILFLPALIAVTPIKHSRKSPLENQPNEDSSEFPPGVMTTFLDALTTFSTTKKKTIFAFSILLLFVSLIGMTRLNFSHNLLSWLPPDLPVNVATKQIDRNLNGSVTLELVLDTGRENGLYDPQMLNKIDQLAKRLESDSSIIVVGKVMSVVDVIKEIHQALNENRPEFYAIPTSAELIPQEFLLFENSGSDDLEDVVDSRFQLARITIKVPWQDALHYVPFITQVDKMGQEIFGNEVSIEITGIMSLFGRIIHAAIYSAALSYLIAACVISVMMILLVGSWRLGIASMLPNLLPIIVILGLMGWTKTPLDMFTMLIGSIAIGIAVDDTVHFVYNFRKYFTRSGDAVAAVRQTLHTTGRAMLATTVVLSLGFFIFMFASMNNLYNFGLLTGLTLILALMADFILAPALFTIIAEKSIGRAELINT